eukprot:gnl/MRDRNA2_/MRDRNA2_136162_c0_seq1.p1 gnl/MRDRNA2_/MRDRNA2_136162_c0~~gnl/MRDRNA2_/MRDRNA2_136162_c0_seq1.p1  ORF type:complete len:279 (-),score=62.86 gnl/MRDRNA2_/MRDRNA2_136162_c0_seq1:42-878(-)
MAPFSGLTPEEEEFAEADAILRAQAANQAGSIREAEGGSSEVNDANHGEWLDGVLYLSSLVTIPQAGPEGTSLSLSIRQVPHTSTCYGSTGGIVWPAATILAEVLPTIEEFRKPNTVVLEIGAGCGIPGLTAAALCTGPGARVVLTDEAAGVLENLQFVYRENAEKLNATVEVARLVWEELLDGRVNSPAENVDVLIGSDLIWGDRAEMVEQVLRRLVRPGGVVVLANQADRGGLDVFETKMSGEDGVFDMNRYDKTYADHDRQECIRVYECRRRDSV